MFLFSLLFFFCFVLFCFVCFGFFLRFQTLLCYLAFQSLTLRVTDEGYSEIPETRLLYQRFHYKAIVLECVMMIAMDAKIIILGDK